MVGNKMTFDDYLTEGAEVIFDSMDWLFVRILYLIIWPAALLGWVSMHWRRR